jgi:hypothetical protein
MRVEEFQQGSSKINNPSLMPLPRIISHIIGGSIFLGVLLLASCASRQLTEYNQGLRRVHNLTDDELRRVQFYNSNTIVLTLADEVREAPNPKRRKQKLDIRHIDQVIIEEHTRGLAVAVGGNWLDISFEEGKALRFELLPNGRFTLKDKIVLYGGQRYRVDYLDHRRSRYPVTLLVRRDLAPKTVVKHKKAKGRKLR